MIAPQLTPCAVCTRPDDPDDMVGVDDNRKHVHVACFDTWLAARVAVIRRALGRA